MGVGDVFTEGRDEEAWLRLFYRTAAGRLADIGHTTPDFDRFWQGGLLCFNPPSDEKILLGSFRKDPVAHPLATPSGRIEIFSTTIDSFGYPDCPGHAAWLLPREWLGAPQARQYPLHLLSNQPKTRLHGQYDNGSVSRGAKVKGREPIRMHPQDAGRRGISDGDVVRVYNARGQCLAGAVLSEAILPGVVQLSTGAWYDPLEPGVVGTLDKHGNPNMLTRDQGTSRLAQGPSAQSCLVEVERHEGVAPSVTAFVPPDIR